MRHFLPLSAAMIGMTMLAMPVSAEPAIADAVIRLPAASGRPAGGFATISADKDDRADQLIAVTSPMAARIELHSMASEGGVMRMRHEADGLPLPAGGTLKLAPGGYHLMLFDVQAGLQAGETVPLTFTFRSGAKITVEAKLVAPGQR